MDVTRVCHWCIGVTDDGQLAAPLVVSLLSIVVHIHIKCMTKVVKALEGIISLKAPVPPMLSDAIGYTGKERFVAFQWTPYGDEVWQRFAGKWASSMEWRFPGRKSGSPVGTNRVLTENCSFRPSLEHVKKPFKINSGCVYQCTGFLASSTSGPFSGKSLPWLYLFVGFSSGAAERFANAIEAVMS
jgi:hypothetical protein